MLTNRALRTALIVAIALSLAACATPSARIQAEAARHGFSRTVLPGREFLHVVYAKSGHPDATILHVYIEGDGAPWRRDSEVAVDPTPRRPLMLALMALDPAPSVYLGRPCYLGLAAVPPCTPRLWTQARYSEAVVLSMATALRRVLAGHGRRGLVFIGHSGGGTLARLLAEHFNNTRAVITLGANLDIDAWTAFHGYTPLRGSLNPAARPGLGPSVIERHYVGARDRQVPPSLLKAYAAAHPQAQLIELRDVDHRCCWSALWPAILTDLKAAFIRE